MSGEKLQSTRKIDLKSIAGSERNGDVAGSRQRSTSEEAGSSPGPSASKGPASEDVH